LANNSKGNSNEQHYFTNQILITFLSFLTIIFWYFLEFVPQVSLFFN
jgi:hypothetical protein